ncbi:hypothetical protein Patl1_27013 [Pistacia atlantica]|uniref:Uncharacterized protein n=1 Tax=Pistacia atlantica TaxID=434234 RepID=A0ACC1B4H3_9ROSI|nr:hypothetical protein Patl1_27013 [Pistacia atlantica]
MTNFRNQTPNGGSAQVDDWQTLSGARSLTRVVNNVYEDKYANVLVIGGHIISTTATRVVGVMRATTIVAMGFSLVIATRLRMPNEVVVWYKRVVGVMRATTIVAMGFSLVIATGLHMPNEVGCLVTVGFSLVIATGLHMPNEVGCLVTVGVLIVQESCRGYESNYNYCHGLQPCYCNWAPYAKRVGCLVTVGYKRVVEGYERATTIIVHGTFNLIIAMGSICQTSHTRVLLSFIFDLVGSLFYGMKITYFRNQTPNGGSAREVDGPANSLVVQESCRGYESNYNYCHGTFTLLFAIPSICQTRGYERATTIVVHGTLALLLTTELWAPYANEVGCLVTVGILIRVVGVMRATTIVAKGFSLVTATRLHMPNELVVLSLLVDDRQTLSGGSDVHDSPPPSKT